MRILILDQQLKIGLLILNVSLLALKMIHRKGHPKVQQQKIIEQNLFLMYLIHYKVLPVNDHRVTVNKLFEAVNILKNV